ncbi:MAG: type I glutamate--ammonia ligase [Candidatus Caldarchaeum sp.]
MDRIMQEAMPKQWSMTKEDVFKAVEKNDIKFIDLQLTDLLGKLHHITISTRYMDEKTFTDGVAKLDGSSIRGFAEIHESDMLLKPDPSTFAVIPWSLDGKRTARMMCDVYKGYGGGRFSRDPRYVAQKAEQYLRTLGYDTSYWGPEIEFFVFDKVQWDATSPYQGVSYKIESREAAWNADGTSLPIRFKEGYYPAPPQDTLMEYRNEVCRVLTDYFGVEIDAHHHEVATAGQCEIDMRFDTLVKMADKAQTYKYAVRNVASQMGMVATFMPKPIFGDNASGMHVHVSLWNKGVNLFYDENDEYAELSQTGRYFVGGLLEHSRALTAITNPTTNSYRRLVPGYEAPVFIAWSRSNRSANIRVPVYFRGRDGSKSKRIEFRTPDTSSNPYLCFAAMAAAGADGIKKKIDPGEPVNEDIYKLSPERRRQLGIRELPGNLREAVEELLSDNEFLKPVISEDLLEVMTELQMKSFIDVSTKPHPYEFYLYFDV